MNRKQAYKELLLMVNREIKYCLSAINHFKEYIELNRHTNSKNFQWEKQIIRDEKYKLKQLKRIKYLLIEDIRFEKRVEIDKGIFCLMGQKGIELYYAKYFKNTEN